MTGKVKELRKIVPVPISEALRLLKENGGDVDKCVALFKDASVNSICELTGCDMSMALEYYETEKLDFNRTVSAIREAIYDKNYKPIDGLTKERISLALQWLRIIETEDFGFSLDFKHLDEVLSVLSLTPSLEETSEIIGKAKEAKNLIFTGYKDSDILEEFVRRHKQLDDSLDFQQANNLISLKVTIIREELLRHSRNL